MTIRRTASRYRPLGVVFGVFALLAVACGSNTTTISAERAAEAPDAPVAAAATSPSGTSHEYGTSIDEWQESDAAPANDDDASAAGTDQDESDTPTVVWDDLIPAGSSGAEIIARYQEDLDAVEPGSEEAEALYEVMRAEFDPEAVNLDLDGQRIRLAGFVAPLTYDGDLVTEFLLVPTFGACVHVPPPPPNQTVMVTLDNDGLSTDDSWGAVWVEGTITIEAAETDLASASYTISNATSGAYNDF